MRLRVQIYLRGSILHARVWVQFEAMDGYMHTCRIVHRRGGHSYCGVPLCALSLVWCVYTLPRRGVPESPSLRVQVHVCKNWRRNEHVLIDFRVGARIRRYRADDDRVAT